MPYVQNRAPPSPTPLSQGRTSVTPVRLDTSLCVSPPCPPLAVWVCPPANTPPHPLHAYSVQPKIHNGCIHVCCDPLQCSTAQCSRQRHEVGLCCLHARLDSRFRFAVLLPEALSTCVSCRATHTPPIVGQLVDGAGLDVFCDDYHLQGTCSCQR